MPPRLPLVVLLAGMSLATATGLRADLAPAAGSPAIKLVIWYDRARPFETFRYRAYDVGKGEYTKAVDDWMALMGRSYPGYTVSVRDLPVNAGDPLEKVTAAVEDEKLALAKSIMLKYGFGDPNRHLEYGSGYRGLSGVPSNRSLFRNEIPRSLKPLGAAHTVPSQPYLFPNPMPYPRPHP